MTLSDLVGVNRQPDFQEFCSFLQTLEVYGAGYSDDVDYWNYNRRNSATHSADMVKQLERVIQCYDLSIYSIQKQNKVEERIKGPFLSLLRFQRSIFSKLLSIQKDKGEAVGNDHLCTPEGHLVHVRCGHRGQPNRAEEKRISRLLRKSGFIPMLDEINQLQ